MFIRFISTLLLVFLFVSSYAQSGSPNVPLLANFDNYHSTGYNDCWGYTAPDGKEYALLGILNGTSIIDISDPTNLNEITFIPGPNSTWKDIKTYQHYAYVVNETSGGMQIIDLSNLPGSAPLVSTYTGFSASHNIFIDEISGILYAQGSSNPVRVISLADPINPIQLTSIGVECHDVFALNNILYVSEGNNGSIGIFDVSTPATPTLLQQLFIPSAGYVHNAWTTEDGNFLWTTEETGGKTNKLWDISDLNNISLTDEILAPDGLAHNAHIKGNYSYVSHYGDGLRIYDIADPYNIFEAGYYDTYPGAAGGYEGAWGAFPFFSTGKILISDRSTGLYVVFFEGAADADSLDPKSPTNFSAYSDYNTPTSVILTWTDPPELMSGTIINSSDLTIEVVRDGILITSVAGGTGQFTDMGLTDGQLYEYEIYAKLVVNDSIGLSKTASWTAGGSMTPSAPAAFSIIPASGGDLNANWTSPSIQDDGTPLDDYAGVYLYENGVMVATFTRTISDTGMADTEVFTPSVSNAEYYVTAYDNESPVNESGLSNRSYPPYSAPYSEDFENAVVGQPGTLPVQWTNETGDDFEWYVNNNGTPSTGTGPIGDHTLGSGNYMYTESTSPNYPGKIALLTTPSIAMNSFDSLSLNFWYHMHGANMGELHVDVYHNGAWVLDVMTPLVGQQQANQTDPWLQTIVDLSTYVSTPIQVRFRGITGSSYTSDIAIDDVHFEVVVNSIENNPELPLIYSISPNFPNPFNPATTIKFDIPKSSDVSLIVYNLLGQEVKTLVRKNMPSGGYNINWNGTSNNGTAVASNIYVYKFRAGKNSKKQKMI